MTNSSHPNHTSQTEPAPSPADAPEIIRYLDNPESLLSRRNPEELWRYLLEAIDPIELRNRQTRLLKCSTEALAAWHDLHQVYVNDTKGGSDKGGTPMLVQFVAWPMVLTLSQSAQIRNVFDCRQGPWPKLANAMTMAWAQCLGIPDRNIRIQDVLLARHCNGASPLQLQSLLLASCNECFSVPCLGSPSNRPEATRKSRVLAEMLGDAPEFSTVAPDHAQVFLLTALVARPPGTEPLLPAKPSFSGKLAMQAIMSAVFTHTRTAPGKKVQYTLHPIHPVVVMGDIEPLADALTQAQGMELAWWAQWARKTDCNIQLHCKVQGSLLHWTMVLCDGEDETTVVDYCYEGTWRPSEHIDAILAKASKAQGAGLIEAVHSKAIYIQ